MTVAELQLGLEQIANVYLTEECVRFNALLENDLESLGALDRLDGQWRLLDRQARSLDADFEGRLTLAYAEWVKRAEGRLQQLEVQRANDCDPEASARFEARVEDARETLATRTRVASSRRARQAALAEGDE